MEKVSIIIPIFNGEKYLIESVKSALNQSYNNTEVIIINDGSRDKSEEIIFSNFKNLIEIGKIKYYKHPTNLGRNIAGNLGAMKSEGEYIFFLDSDDLWDKEHIEKTIKLMKELNLDVAFIKPRKFIDENGKIKRISKSKINEDLGKIIFSSKIGFPSATAFKKDTFIYYNPEFKFREDIELFIRAYLENKRIKILDLDTVMIREHSTSGRMSKSNNFYIYTLKLYQYYKDKVPPKYLPYFLLHISEISFKFSDFKNGYKFLFLAFKENPKIFIEFRYTLTILKRIVRIDKLIK